MANSKKPSKFQFVQSFFADNPKAKADAAVAAASKAGLDISVQYARQIRSKSKGSSPKKKKPQRSKPVPKSSVVRAKKSASKKSPSTKPKKKPETPKESSANIDQALEAVRFIKNIGDIKTARQAIDAAEAILLEVHATDV